MIFFFGTRSGKTETKKLEDVSCPHCEQSNTLTASKTSNYIHIFWIRLIKISTNSIAECSYCKRGFYENEFTKEMTEVLKMPYRHSNL